MADPMVETWAVDGVELPESFVFPVTKLGVTEDVHGAGAFVTELPTRVECHVHVEIGSEPHKDSQRLEILSSLSPYTNASCRSRSNSSNSSHSLFGCIEACLVES